VRPAIVIPARYASSRLPGKPLLRQTGKYMIQHVYERASEARCVDQVIVATEDPRIVAAVRSFGGNVIMTSPRHATGTDRVAEVARGLGHELIINLQGDEPLVDPASIDVIADLLNEDRNADMATVAVPLRDRAQYTSTACVKVVCDAKGAALYFSRSPIPAVRDGDPPFDLEPPSFFQHLGIYGYRRDTLLHLASLPPTALEQLEKLEQLRALANGMRIRVGIVHEATIGVDTFDDYQRFVRTWRKMQVSAAA